MKLITFTFLTVLLMLTETIYADDPTSSLQSTRVKRWWGGIGWGGGWGGGWRPGWGGGWGGGYYPGMGGGYYPGMWGGGWGR